ncbi:MAG: 30S ribosomal protein S8 [Patescibacteria group bacterium]
MYNDTVSDFLTRIRNAFMAQKKVARVRHSKMVEDIANILKKEGFISSFTKDGYNLDVELDLNVPLNHIKRLSKPGIRRYVKYSAIPRPRSGFGMVIISTPKGVLTGHQAKKQKVGGELICELW